MTVERSPDRALPPLGLPVQQASPQHRLRCRTLDSRINSRPDCFDWIGLRMTTLQDHGRSEIPMLRCPLDDRGPSLYPTLRLALRDMSLLHKGVMVAPWFGRSVRNVAETEAGHTGPTRDAGRVAVVCCMGPGPWW
jgi:hypothetical protein